jgi:hypothetical protein
VHESCSKREPLLSVHNSYRRETVLEVDWLVWMWISTECFRFTCLYSATYIVCVSWRNRTPRLWWVLAAVEVPLHLYLQFPTAAFSTNATSETRKGSDAFSRMNASYQVPRAFHNKLFSPHSLNCSDTQIITTTRINCSVKRDVIAYYITAWYRSVYLLQNALCMHSITMNHTHVPRF